MTSIVASAWGVGVATYADMTDNSGQPSRVLDTWYPAPALGTPDGDPGPAVAGSASAGRAGRADPVDPAGLAAELGAMVGRDERRGVHTELVRTVIDLTAPPADAPDAYLRLHLLSHRLVRPHQVNLDGVFGVLANVVWTNHGPCPVDGFELTRLRLRASGTPVQVYGVDRFPRMTDYVLPSGVRIADADRVRLGAHLAEGTTVMHEGFVNFNAGTLGASMVEGRISAGVVVGEGSDVGGGASIMGTLSGGGSDVVSVGRGCLLGANSGIGISLGDDCVVEAGCYVTAGAKVTIEGRTVKARQLSGRSGLLFRRNSVSGALEAVPRTAHAAQVHLNSALHAND